MSSAISFGDGPFPVSTLSADGHVRASNAAWSAVAGKHELASEALGLFGSDHDDFVDTVRLVAVEKAAAWLDAMVHVLGEKRWSRCHMWPAPSADEVIVAVIALREPRGIEMSRVELEHIERVLEHTADAVTIIDRNMAVRFASGVSADRLGMAGSASEGSNALDMVFPDDHHIFIDAFARCIYQPFLSIKARFRVVHGSGDVMWVEGIATNMFDDPTIRGILVSLNDITELVEALASAEQTGNALELEMQRYEMLAQFMPTGVFELDDADNLTFHNSRFAQLIELGPGSSLQWDIFDPRDRAALAEAFDRTRLGLTTQSTVRLAPASTDEPERWLTIRAVRQANGRVLGSVEDATSQIAKQTELAHRAGHDDLTGLPNRENLLELLDEINLRGEPFALLFLDLDSFKDINDALGHQVGDQVLIEIADRISSVVRPTDIVGRLHGDEFLVICRHTEDIRTARVVAARAVQIVSRPLKAAAQLVVSGSIGIAMSNEAGPKKSPEQLLGAADVAMYEAKRRGGSRSVPFNSDLGKRAADRLRLHADVQRASELDELELHYQPIVDLRTGEADRYEALVRWHHPTHGFILPGRFIPEIERSELIDQLGMWVIDRAITDLAADPGGDHAVNVNVSPRQLADGSFAQSVLSLLEANSVDARRLTIEMTELTQMEEFETVEKQLSLLQSEDVGVAIDDFGTGYSALSYLHRFPFDQIKIDGVFVETIDTSTKDQAVMGSLIDLVHSLGSIPVAEKVERQAQADALIDLGCPLAQGFLLGKPSRRLDLSGGH